jgi:hypothetical protein
MSQDRLLKHSSAFNKSQAFSHFKQHDLYSLVKVVKFAKQQTRSVYILIITGINNTYVRNRKVAKCLKIYILGKGKAIPVAGHEGP